ncbi:hypothetical protein FVEG_08248 [Fusarium verticillioides 7600]|uniref:Uncharacterized protein n=1 Tax=Gibberella moniliformis (strain M3125 / FGSC 7600) TaxID=334819 RepID=W7MLU7_GIBM7|nr:hypothetical protein FVEG_08248 [Fusarium verticillioides 7600]EWG48500.1 hypothetical protein FVEG_08248 [Fusarium verticillioides 7600]
MNIQYHGDPYSIKTAHFALSSPASFSKVLCHHGHEILHKNCGLCACIRSRAEQNFCIILICRVAGRRINLRAFATRAAAVHKPNYVPKYVGT